MLTGFGVSRGTLGETDFGRRLDLALEKPNLLLTVIWNIEALSKYFIVINSCKTLLAVQGSRDRI